MGQRTTTGMVAEGLAGALPGRRLRDHQGANYDRNLNGSQLTF